MELIKRTELRRAERIRKAIALLREARMLILADDDRLSEQKRAVKRVDAAIEQATSALRQAINAERN